MFHDPSGAIVSGIFGAFFLLYFGLIILVILATVFWIVELVDVARREFPDPNTKLIWLVVILLSHGIGSLIYYFVGRQQGYLPAQRPIAYPSTQSSDNSWPPPPGEGR